MKELSIGLLALAALPLQFLRKAYPHSRRKNRLPTTTLSICHLPKLKVKPSAKIVSLRLMQMLVILNTNITLVVFLISYHQLINLTEEKKEIMFLLSLLIRIVLKFIGLSTLPKPKTCQENWPMEEGILKELLNISEN